MNAEVITCQCIGKDKSFTVVLSDNAWTCVQPNVFQKEVSLPYNVFAPDSTEMRKDLYPKEIEVQGADAWRGEKFGFLRHKLGEEMDSKNEVFFSKRELGTVFILRIIL